MADENYAIRVSFDGIDKAINDIKSLQTAIAALKIPTGKINLEVDAQAVSKSQAKILATQDKIQEQEAKRNSATLSNIETIAKAEISASQKTNDTKIKQEKELVDLRIKGEEQITRKRLTDAEALKRVESGKPIFSNEVADPERLGSARLLKFGQKATDPKQIQDLVVEASKRLNEEFALENLVPVDKIRAALKGRASSEDIDSAIKSMGGRIASDSKAGDYVDRRDLPKSPSASFKAPQEVSAISQAAFEKLVTNIIKESTSKKGQEDFTPIYKVREKVGDQVSRSDFDRFLKDFQASGKAQMFGGGVEDDARNKLEDSILSKVSGLRSQIKLTPSALEEPPTKATVTPQKAEEKQLEKTSLIKEQEKEKLASIAKVESAQIASDKKILENKKQISAAPSKDVAKEKTGAAEMAVNLKLEAAQIASNSRIEAAQIASNSRIEAAKIASATKLTIAEQVRADAQKRNAEVVAQKEAALTAKKQADADKLAQRESALAAKRQSDAEKLAQKEAALAAKKQADVDKLAQKESERVAKSSAIAEKLAQKEVERIAKIDAAAEKQRQKEAANNAKQATNLQSQLDKQLASSRVRATDGGDKEAARIAQETLRYKQQIAAIDAKLINPADIANAKALAAEINKLNLEKIKKGFDDATPVTFNQFIGATTEKARDLAEQLQNTSQTLERIGTTFNQVAQASGEAFLAFDSARVKVGALSKDSQGLALQSKQLVNELGNQATSTEVLAANYQILSSGFTKSADVTDITRASLIGATAGFTDTATVADALTSVLNAYGKQASEAGKIVDQFIVTQDRGKTIVAEFAANLGNVIPIAANAGVSFEEVQGALATLTLQGVKSDTAITNIKNVISDIVAPSRQAQKAFEGIGIANSAATLKSEGLIGVLRRIQEAGKSGAKELSQFFGDIRSQAGVTGLLKGELQSFAEITADITNRSGKSLQDYNAIAESAQGRVTAAFNKINEALVNLGGGVVRAFSPLIAAVGGAIDVFNQLPEPIQTVLGGVIGLVGGVATLGAALTAIGAAAPAFVGGLKLFGIQAAASTVATTGLATANTVTATSFVGLGVSAKAAAASFVSFATTVTTTVTGVGTLLATGAILAGTFAVVAVKAIASIVVAIAPLVATLGAVFLAFESVRNTANLFGEINSNKAEDAFDKILNKASAVDAKLKDATATSKSFTDKLAGGFDKVENPFQGAALAITNLGNALIGAESGASKFGSQFGFITQQQLEAQKTAIAYGNAITTLDGSYQASLNIVGKYGNALDFERRITQLSGDEKKEYQKQLTATSTKLKEELAQLEAIGKQQGVDQNANKLRIDAQKVLISQSDQKIAALKKEEEAIKAVSDAERDRAKQLRETQNQDAERGIKRTFEDAKAKRDRENAKAVAAIEEQNALKKGELDRRQALETEALKERQALALQDKQRAFEDGQNAKKIAAEQALENRKQSFEAKQQSAKQAFEDRLNSEKEARAEQQRKADEAFANARAARDKQASEAQSGAKQLISDEGAIATAKPEERAKLAAQLAEENRIRTQAAQQGQGGVQSQEQLVAQAKQLAQVSAIATKEEQAKVQLALDELEKANKAKQAEIDKAEDAKRLLAQQESEKAFDLAQQEAKRAFDAQQKAESLNFENSVLKPEKQKIEAELNAQKLAFERGELAALKKAQAAEERALQLQQTNEDLALQKAATAELDALKLAQKEKEIALDRAFEDQKIERERTFKEQQRALDKASAIEIQAILGKSAQQIINAIAVTKGGNVLSSTVGVKGVETQATKAVDPLTQIKAGADAAIASKPITKAPTENVNAAGLAVLKALGKGKTPAFSQGVTNFRGGMALVGEQGAELVTLPRGSNVLPAPQTKSLINNNSGGNKTYNVNVTTAATNALEVASQVQKELARAAALSF